jgi:hypothetical protein
VVRHVHSAVQASPDFDDSSGSYPVQQKVTSATTVSRDVERAKTPHDLVPGFGPTNLGDRWRVRQSRERASPDSAGTDLQAYLNDLSEKVISRTAE